MTNERKPALLVRRVLRQDLPSIEGLYAGLGRDGVWTQGGALAMMLHHGTLWAGFRARGMCICGGLCPADAPVPIGMAMRATGLLPEKALLVLPPAGSEGDMRRFTEILLAHAAQQPALGTPVALVSVKYGSGFVTGCLNAQMMLVAVRPLVALRPHYIFLPRSVQNGAQNSIMVAIQDTLRLSRLLEEGWRGVAQWGAQLELQK